MSTVAKKKAKPAAKKFVNNLAELAKEMEKASIVAEKRIKMLEQAGCVSQELMRLEVSM